MAQLGVAFVGVNNPYVTEDEVNTDYRYRRKKLIYLHFIAIFFYHRHNHQQNTFIFSKIS